VAKKSRTPAPPRPVQAPKRRYDRTSRGGWSTRTWITAGVVAAAAAIAIGLGVALVGGGGGGSADPSKALVAAGCTFKTFPDLGARHVESLEAKVKYNSFPPTSGSHYFQPVIWGRYPSPISQVQGVHNLEHGGVIIQYGSGAPQATVDRLGAFYDDSPNALLLSPLPELKNKIALTAWTHLALCPHLGEAAFKAFRDAYRGKGPERFPVNSLTPGT
jgi:hypothetical protein